MIDVLNRRAQIEEELKNLVIERPADDTTTRYRPQAPVATNPPVRQQQLPAVDTVSTKPITPQPPPAVVNARPAQVDTTARQPVTSPDTYAFNSTAPHYVVVVLNKVDRIFGNEAKNAFARYNRDTYFNKQMSAELIDIDQDNRLLLISPFDNADAAVQYVEKTRPVTASQIVPWLRGGKYYYIIITAANLEILKNSKDVDKYKQFLDNNLPGKF
jgi:hypothetical protein